MQDFETDVVVVGYGGAGASAAITASQAGAKVIVLEKNPEGGGNTKYSGGTLRQYTDLTKVADHFEALCEGTTERSVIDAYVEENNRNSEWLEGIGTAMQPLSSHFAKRFPAALPFLSVPGSEAIGPRFRAKGPGIAGGTYLWEGLSRRVESDGITVMYNSPAKELLYTRETGVTGVIASQGGRDIRIRAKRGVVLSCGGFEDNQDMHMNYYGQRYSAMGNPGNTGDGIKMAIDVGADLWHMNACAATMGYKLPDFDFGIRQLVPSAGFIYVDQAGARFADETGLDVHIAWAPTSMLDFKTLARPRMPSYTIFDEDTRLRGAVGATFFGKIRDVYQWSEDNVPEIKKGWIKVGNTLGELALQIGVKPEQLQATVDRYNQDCANGSDPAFGRAADNLVPLLRAPFYAIETWPTLFNTQGGPKRNARAQVLNTRGQAIKRLYSAGELGSIWHRNYPGAGNVSEALAFGRIAGRNVTAEAPL